MAKWVSQKKQNEKYTKKQITEAIAYWQKYVLNENFAKKFENDTAMSLVSILKKSTGIHNVALFLNANKPEVDEITSSFADKGYVTLDSTDCDIAVVHTGNSNNKSDLYVIYVYDGNVLQIGIELKAKLESILFTTSFSLDTKKINDAVFSSSDDAWRNYLNERNVLSLFSNINVVQRTDDPDERRKYAEYVVEDLDMIMKSIRRRWFDKSNYGLLYLPKDFVTLNGLSKFNSLTTNNYNTAAFEKAIINDKQKLEQKILTVLGMKCHYELENLQRRLSLMDLAQLTEDTLEFKYLYSIVMSVCGHSSYALLYPLSLKCRFIKPSTLVRKLKSAKLFDFTVYGTDIIKWYFNSSRDSSTEYKPVYYIQLGQKYSYNTYKLTDADPLGFDSSSLKTGDISDKYYGIIGKSAFRAYNDQDKIQFVTRVYPLLDDPDKKLGSIYNGTLLCNFKFDKHHILDESIGNATDGNTIKMTESAENSDKHAMQIENGDYGEDLIYMYDAILNCRGWEDVYTIVKNKLAFGNDYVSIEGYEDVFDTIDKISDLRDKYDGFKNMKSNDPEIKKLIKYMKDETPALLFAIGDRFGAPFDVEFDIRV